MRIPDSFKKAIKDVFYDKEITLYTSETVTDSEGWTDDSVTESGSFLGNAIYSGFDKIQEQYGIKDSIDLVITTDENIPNNSIIGYGGFQYRIFRVIPNDSHYLLVAKVWLSKSSTLISS